MATLSSSQDDIWATIQKLCFYSGATISDGESSKDHPISCLLENVLAWEEAPMVSIHDAAILIKATFQIDVTDDEVLSASESMVSKGVADRSGASGSQISLKSGRRSELRSQAAEIQELEETVFRDWRAELAELYPPISEAGKDELLKDLQTVLTRVFIRHGAECSALLNSGSREAEALYEQIYASLGSQLPAREGLIGRIRDLEIVRFFKEAPGNRLRFFSHLLRSSYLLHTTQLDAHSISAIRRELNGVILYLDTNMIFALLGINGESKRAASERVVKGAVELGMSVRLTSHSVNEFLFSFENAKSALGAIPPLDAEMAKIPAQLGEESLLKAYYQQYGQDGDNFDLFVSEYRITAGRLSEFGLEVGDDLEDEILNDPGLQELAARIYENSHKAYESTYGRLLPMRVCEHDAFHILLIQKRRGATPTSFANAKAWFVTWDGKLPRFARMERSKLGVVPFCASTPVWLSFLSNLTLRSDDYEATAAAMLWSSGLQASIELPVDRLARIASVLRSVEGKDPQLVMLMLLDEKFSNAIRTTPEPQFEAAIPKLIDESAIAVMQDIEQEAARSAGEYEKTIADQSEARQADSMEHEEEVARLTTDFASLEQTLTTKVEGLDRQVEWYRRREHLARNLVISFLLFLINVPVWIFTVNAEESGIFLYTSIFFSSSIALLITSIWIGWDNANKLIAAAASLATLSLVVWTFILLF